MEADWPFETFRRAHRGALSSQLEIVVCRRVEQVLTDVCQKERFGVSMLGQTIRRL